MDILETVFRLLAAVVLSTNESASKIKDNLDDKYERSYQHSSERYSKMSDKELNREINRLKTTNSDNIVVKVSKINAMKDEIAERREKR